MVAPSSVWRRVRPFLRRLAGIGLGLAGLVVCANIYVHVRGARAVVTAEAAAASGPRDAIVVLGAGVWSTGPSPVLEDRLRTALGLFQRGVASRIVLSGDHGRPTYNEPEAMRAWLSAHGVPDEAMELDHAGFDTYSSMVRARNRFRTSRVVVVTQRFHLPRALYIANAVGLDAVGVAADHVRYTGNPMHAAREIVGRPVALFDCARGRIPNFPY